MKPSHMPPSGVKSQGQFLPLERVKSSIGETPIKLYVEIPVSLILRNIMYPQNEVQRVRVNMRLLGIMVKSTSMRAKFK